MSHLNDKLAEFFYGELSPSEMSTVRGHLDGCGECRQELEQLQRTHHALKALPDIDPPRQIVFGFEKRPPAAGWIPRWLAPMAASAAVAMAVVTVAPRQMQQQPIPVPVAVQQPAQPIVAQPVDYERIIRDLDDSQRAWLVEELSKRDAARQSDVRQIRAEIAYYEDFQRTVLKETFENASSIQLLAQRYEPKE